MFSVECTLQRSDCIRYIVIKHIIIKITARVHPVHLLSVEHCLRPIHRMWTQYATVVFTHHIRTLSQTFFADLLVVYSYLWHIPLTWLTSQGDSGMVWLKNKEQTFELPEPVDTSSWIKLNLNETAYVRVNYMTSIWRALASALQRQHTVRLRLRISLLS